MQVKYSYLDRQFMDVKAVLADIEALVHSGDFTLGKAVAEFEGRFGGAIGAKHAIGVNSGTEALSLALQAVGVQPGDEVITAANTFIATVGAIVAAGARPVLVDVDETHCIDVTRIEAAITPKTRAIMPVHWAGRPADMPAIMALATRRNLPVVEDACQAYMAAIGGKAVGTFAAAGGFSLHPLKPLNVWGDGGIIVTNSDALADHLRLRRNHGLRDRDTVEIFGVNSRLDTLQAVVGNHFVGLARDITDRRIAAATRLDAGLARLAPDVRIPPRKPDVRHVYQIYVIEATRRDDLVKYLLAQGIDAKVHYPVPLHLQPAFKPFGYKAGDFPVTEAQARSVVTLPAHQHLTDEELDYVIQHVARFYGR